MGQHTWFAKDKNLYLKQQELYKRIDNNVFEKDNEIYWLYKQIDDIESEIDVTKEYHDLFRTGKRNINNSYTDDIITSKSECFDWINKDENLVYFNEMTRENVIMRLNDFWETYPNGIIYFA